MIHQFIFTYPKPGMTEESFYDYWINYHAVRYASKIPQIKKYLIDTRIALPFETGEPRWSGIAEIWLNNLEEQIASLQTPQYLEGARRDEPNWAAFWRTVVLDTTAHDIFPGSLRSRDEGLIKAVILRKRKSEMPLDAYRETCLGAYADRAKNLPGLRRYTVGLVNDNFYAVGEALLDSVEQLWFDNVASYQTAMDCPEATALNAMLGSFTNPKYTYAMIVREHWIIGPEPRA